MFSFVDNTVATITAINQTGSETPSGYKNRAGHKKTFIIGL